MSNQNLLLTLYIRAKFLVKYSLPPSHLVLFQHPRLASVAPLTDRSYTVVQEPGSLDALIPLTGTMATDALLSGLGDTLL